MAGSRANREIAVWAVPFAKDLVTRALESGADAVVVEPDKVAAVRELGRITTLTPDEVVRITLNAKADEEAAAQALAQGRTVVLARPWEIIPVENLIAAGGCATGKLGLEVASLEEARLAAGIMERGVDLLVPTAEAAPELAELVRELKLTGERAELVVARITAIRPAGMGHRVCVDTTTLLEPGEGMLVGDGSAFSFLVAGETEENPYVAARPFRINAGAVHAYAHTPGGRTAYLQELGSGRETLLVAPNGATRTGVVGRLKIEVRPMLRVSAEVNGREGSVFLQNAETIRLVTPDGKPVSVVRLEPGDEVLVHLGASGRHFGMAVSETIKEV